MPRFHCWMKGHHLKQPSEITISLEVDACSDSRDCSGAAAQAFTLRAIATMSGNTTVTVTVSDGMTTAEERIEVTVIENVAPAITGLVDQTIETNTTETVSFTVTDANTELGDIVSVSVAETGAEILNIGTVMPDEDNSYSVDILGKMGGQTTLTVTAIDSAMNPVVQSVQVTINTAPEIDLSDAEISLLDEGTPSTAPVMVTVTDADVADEITISLEVDATAPIVEIVPASVMIEGGADAMRAAQTFTLRAIATMSGNTTVTVTVSDGTTTAEERIEVTVIENVAPAITGLIDQTIETNTTETVSFTVTDANTELGDIVSVSVAETGAEILNIGTVMPDEDNSYSVDILGKMGGQTTLTVTAIDSAMNPVVQSVQVTINTAPEIDLSDAEISLLDEGTPSEAEVMVTVTDADVADEITISLEVDAAAPIVEIVPASVMIEGGADAMRAAQAFTLRAIATMSGNTTVTVTVSDGTTTVEERIEVTVAENIAPVIASIASIDNLQIETQVQVGFTVMDANGDISVSSIVVEVEDSDIITAIGDVEEISEVENGYRVSITAGATARNTTLTVTVTDTAGNEDTQEVRVTVVETRVNAAPQITQVMPKSLTLLDAGPRNTGEVKVSVSDDAAGTVGITMVAQPANLLTITPPTPPTVALQASRVAIESDAFSIVAADIEVRTTVMVTITATDSELGEATTTIEVVIEPNVAPGIAMVAEQIVPLSGMKTVEFTVTDANGNIDANGIMVEETAGDTDIITISAVQSVEGEANTYSVEITGNTAGMTTMTIRAMDDAGEPAESREVRVRVNTAPSIDLSDAEISLLDEGTPSTAPVMVTVTDADVADEITISLEVDTAAPIVTISPTNAMIAGGAEAIRAEQTFTLSAIAGMVDNTTVTVTVMDGIATAKASIVVTVTENVAPVITGLADQTIETNTTATVDFRVTDMNADIVTVSADETDASILNIGTVMPGSEDNSYSVDIRGEMSSQTTLTVTATDSANQDVTASIQVTVNATPRIELSTRRILLLDAGATSNAEVNVTATDDDVTDEIRIELTVDAAAPIVTISPTDAMIAGSTEATRAAQTFTIQAIDGMLGNTTVTVVVGDGKTRDEESIVVTVEENEAPMITTIEPIDNLQIETLRQVGFTIEDANGDISTSSITVKEVEDSNIISAIGEVEKIADTNSYRVAITAGATVGNTTLTVTVTDTARNEDIEAVRVTVVETGINKEPQITRVLPKSLSLLDIGAGNTGSVQVDVSDDEQGKVTIEMEAQTANRLTITPTTSTVAIPASGVAVRSSAFTIEAMDVDIDTTVIVDITAEDSKGGESATTTIEVVIEANVAPEIEIAMVDEQVVQVGEMTLVEFTVTDDNGNLDINSITVTAADMGLLIDIGAVESVEGEANTYSVVVTGLTAGMTTMTISAMDDARVPAESREVRVRVNAAPQITLSDRMISLLDEGMSSTASVVVTVTDADAADEITIELTVDPDASVEIAGASTATIASNTAREAQSFTLRARENTTGTAIVTVRVSDGAATDEATVEVTVIENVAPAITGLVDQTIETNTTETVSFTVTDANTELGDIVSVSVAETGAEILNIGTVMPDEDNSYSVDILGKMGGQTTLTVTAIDSAMNPVIQSVQVTINTAPEIDLSDAEVSLLDEGTPSTAPVMVTVTDADVADEITISLEVDATAPIVEIVPASVMIEGGADAMRAAQTFTLRAIATMSGNTTVTVTVSDGMTTAEERIEVTVIENVAPAITGLVDQTIETNTTETVSFTVTDANTELGDIVSVSVAETGAEILNIGTVMPDEDNSYSVDILGKMGGQTTLTVTAIDSAMNPVVQSVQVTINTAPEIDLSDAEISLLDEGTPSEAEVMVTVTDADVADEITISLTMDAAAPIVEIVPASVMIEGGADAMRAAQTFTLSAIATMSGNTTVTVTVSDGTTTAEERIVVTVIENVAPAITITGLVNQTIEPNTTETVSFTVMDTNAALGDIVTVTAAETGGASILNIGTVMPGSVDILGKVAGQTTLTVTATDSAGNKDTQEARVTIESTGIRIRVRVFLEGPLR